MNHPTRRLRNPATGKDAELATIIETLWSRGVDTLQCCQHDEYLDSAWIQFAGANDAAAFAGMLFIDVEPDSDDIDDDLFDRQRDWEIATPCEARSRDAWRWRAAPDGDWGLDVMVEFPRTDISEVERRLLAAPDFRPGQRSSQRTGA